MGLTERIKGDLYLAWRAAVAHPLRLLFSTDDRSGRERFLSNYAVEGNLPTSEADRRVLQGAARCIHCGLCDAYDPSLSKLPRTVSDGPSLLPIALARATPDLPHAREVLRAIDDSALRQAERVCPTRVPLVEIAVYLRSKLAELDALRGTKT